MREKSKLFLDILSKILFDKCVKRFPLFRCRPKKSVLLAKKTFVRIAKTAFFVFRAIILRNIYNEKLTFFTNLNKRRILSNKMFLFCQKNFNKVEKTAFFLYRGLPRKKFFSDGKREFLNRFLILKSTKSSRISAEKVLAVWSKLSFL